MYTKDQVIAQAQVFLTECEEMRLDYFKEHYPTTISNFPDDHKLEMKVLQKFVRFTSKGSCWAFIDLSNGDILKPASFKTPAKHARGNIFADNRMDSVNWTGPKYLK